MVPNSAAYLKIANTGTVADRLLGVSGDVAARVKLRETRLESGMMTMRPMTEGIAIAPGATLVLAPHGLHVMLIGLRTRWRSDKPFLTLRFEQAGEVARHGDRARARAMSAPADAATSRWRQPRRGLLAATGFMAVLALVLGIWFGRALMSRVSPEPPAIAGLLIEPPIALPDMILTQHTGEPLTTASFQGRWNLLFFGFASCPDVCPTTLQQLKQAMKTLAARNRDGTMVWLISGRSRARYAQAIGGVISFFDPAFRGAIGSHAGVAEARPAVGGVLPGRAAKGRR